MSAPVQLLYSYQAPSGSSYSAFYTITIDHTKIPNTDRTDFDVLFSSPVGTVNTVATAVAWVSGTKFPPWIAGRSILINGVVYTVASVTTSIALVLTGSAGTQSGVAYCGTPELRTVANGGSVQNTVTVAGLSVPADAVFSSDNAGASLYAWEFKAYDATTGAIVAFTKIPTLSHTVDPVYYLPYNNVAVTTYQCTVTDTWASKYKGVYHLGRATLSALDSTVNANNGTISNVTATSGQIDGGAANFATASSPSIDLGTSSTLKPTTKLSVSMWIEYTSAISNTRGTNDWHSDASTDRYIMPYANSTVFGWYIKSSGGLENGIFVSYSTATRYLIHGTYDGSTGTIEFLINGVSQGTLSGFASTMNTNSLSVYMGKQLSPATDSFLDAKVQEYRIIDATVPADEALTEYNNQFSPNTFYSVT